MPSTTNFSWTTPADTDYVKDGASAIRTLANGIDTSMAQLKGGTTGQVLSKTNGTDMSFTWITPQVGDITSVAVTSPLTGGGTTGDVTIAIQSASTTQSGAVQLTDSTSSTSTTTAATPNSVKTSYDLASAAIPKSTVTTKGDLILGTAASTVARQAVGTNNQILYADSAQTNGVAWGASAKSTLTTTGDLLYASSANTLARLGIGSSNQILTVSGGVPTWSTPASSASGLTLVTTGTFSAVSALNVNSCFTSTYTSYRIILDVDTVSAASADFLMRLRASGSDKTGSNYNIAGSYTLYQGTSASGFYGASGTSWYGMGTGSGKSPFIIMDIHKPQLTANTLFTSQVAENGGSGSLAVYANGNYNATDSVDGFSAYCSSGTISGTYWVYGYQKS